jgi:hypothetical protein
MTFEAAVTVLGSIKTRELELKNDLIIYAVRYARIRADWQLAVISERRVMESQRTSAHNSLIDAANILSRAMSKIGEETTWREKLGNDRKEIGDWACYIHAHLGIQAR